MLVKSHFASIERAKGSSGGSEESDAEIEGKSKSRQRQHTPTYLTENRTQKFAEYWRNYISRRFEKAKGFVSIWGMSRNRRWWANLNHSSASIPPRISLKTRPRKSPNAGEITFHFGQAHPSNRGWDGFHRTSDQENG
jgi:hypothetical protein